ncbi:MAG: aminotransferase class I/II-fold pyridoxal phosphate-dependent enzyme, partial [Acidobacteria bacterium]|nr:aminotransferase class I/II-fold pyridoxal phosphate-dependent enzyme [Acidobacteriota bacterium]
PNFRSRESGRSSEARHVAHLSARARLLFSIEVEVRGGIRKDLPPGIRVAPDQVLVGNGSNELLVAVMQCLVDAETTVIVAHPSFSLYEHYARILGATIVGASIDLQSGLLPVETMVAAAGSSSGRTVIFACSPNNPSGSVLPPGGLERLLETGAMVMLDRAYGEFVDQAPPPPMDRLIILSTFSKAWGLAGLRIGWLTSTAEIVREIRKVKLPYNLNVASEEIALAALEEKERLSATIEAIVRDRDFMAGEMRELGLEVFPSSANFLLFRTDDADRVFNGLLFSGVLVRDVSAAPGLSGCLRVSVGTREENQSFIGALRALVPTEVEAAPWV